RSRHRGSGCRSPRGPTHNSACLTALLLPLLLERSLPSFKKRLPIPLVTKRRLSVDHVQVIVPGRKSFIHELSGDLLPLLIGKSRESKLLTLGIRLAPYLLKHPVQLLLRFELFQFRETLLQHRVYSKPHWQGLEGGRRLLCSRTLRHPPLCQRSCPGGVGGLPHQRPLQGLLQRLIEVRVRSEESFNLKQRLKPLLKLSNLPLPLAQALGFSGVVVHAEVPLTPLPDLVDSDLFTIDLPKIRKRRLLRFLRSLFRRAVLRLLLSVSLLLRVLVFSFFLRVVVFQAESDPQVPLKALVDFTTEFLLVDVVRHVDPPNHSRCWVILKRRNPGSSQIGTPEFPHRTPASGSWYLV